MSDAILLKDIAQRLNSISWDILTLLYKTEELSYSEIKNKLKVSQDKASKEIARLEGALLVDSRRDDIDTRYIKFKITDNGMNIMQHRR